MTDDVVRRYNGARPIQAPAQLLADAIHEIEVLREENTRLREVLKPFAGILKGNYSHQSDDMPIKAGANQYDLVFVFTLGDLRAAAAAIREGGKE